MRSLQPKCPAPSLVLLIPWLSPCHQPASWGHLRPTKPGPACWPLDALYPLPGMLRPDVLMASLASSELRYVPLTKPALPNLLDLTLVRDPSLAPAPTTYLVICVSIAHP